MEYDVNTVIDEALKDYYNENYESAHKKYDWFFENAEKIKPSMRGVRVSFCLGGWVDVAKKYPPAMERIKELKANSLNSFKETGSIKAFRDFSSISGYLNLGEEVLDIFLALREINNELAAQIFSHAYAFLVEKMFWDICAEYMDDFENEYKIAFHVYDHTLKRMNEVESDEEVLRKSQEHRIALFKNNTIPIFKILTAKGDKKKFESYLSRISSDLNERGQGELFYEIVKAI